MLDEVANRSDKGVVEMTNNDMLHEAIADPETWRRRRSGKTTIMIHRLAGQIQCSGIRHIAIWLHDENDVDYIFPMIRDVFREQGIKITDKKGRVFKAEYNCRTHQIMFLSSKNREREINMLRGLDWVEFDFDDYVR